MSMQNGSSNGVVSKSTDEITSSAGVHMTLVDETGGNTVNGERRPSVTSRDSLDPDEDGGNDNPAFEADVEANHVAPEAERNGKAAGNNQKDQTSKVSNGSNGATKENGRGADVEMVPLNPTAPIQTKPDKKTAATANGNPGKNKGQTKVALDSMYNDYFRPVNTRRKLLRGEKLYVTRDQREHSRSWKWFAFWGGVFTFIAAALLTGILAATGIIMSKKEPTSFNSPNSLLGNFSITNDTLEFENEDVMNGTLSNDTKFLEITTVHSDVHFDHDHKMELEPVHSTELPQTTESDLTSVADLGNALEDNSLGISNEHLPPDGGIGWFSSDNVTTTAANVASNATTPLAAVVEDATTESERGRSLEEDSTLFPALNETLLFEGENNTSSNGSETSPNNEKPSDSDFVSPTNASTTIQNATEVENGTDNFTQDAAAENATASTSTLEDEVAPVVDLTYDDERTRSFMGNDTIVAERESTTEAGMESEETVPPEHENSTEMHASEVESTTEAIEESTETSVETTEQPGDMDALAEQAGDVEEHQTTKSANNFTRMFNTLITEDPTTFDEEYPDELLGTHNRTIGNTTEAPTEPAMYDEEYPEEPTVVSNASGRASENVTEKPTIIGVSRSHSESLVTTTMPSTTNVSANVTMESSTDTYFSNSTEMDGIMGNVTRMNDDSTTSKIVIEEEATAAS